MKFRVTYKENSTADCIVFEAADLETVKKAVNQWRVNELRLKKRQIDIVSIFPW
jgi:hypothetical protein